MRLPLLLHRAQFSLPLYWVIVSLAHAEGYAVRLREKEQRQAVLEVGLARAQLEALEAQLQPHFLFNTLNSITALIRPNPEAAETMVADLSDLLRATLEARASFEVPLRREIELLDRYAAIQQVRLADRVSFEWRIPDSVRDALVPPFILQPLVENSLEHGAGCRTAGGHVVVSAWTAAEGLFLEVRDNGPEPTDERPASAEGGIGLGNTRERLRALYGEDHKIVLRTRPGEGLEIQIRIPHRQQRPLGDDKVGNVDLLPSTP